jgi:preprotein translocase subunit SecA
VFNLFDSNEKQIKKLKPLVEQINSLEDAAIKMTPENLKEKTLFWKNELKNLSIEEQNKYLEKILPEAFSIVREAGKRVLNMRHFDVQLIAGIVLHHGRIAEQKTGEGKTLTATLPLYLNCLPGRGAHLVTPNDYLSRHGAGWMGPLYNFLGVSVGVIMQERAFVYDPSFQGSEFEDAYAVHLKEVSRQEAYKSDVVYGTNHEFGFDYLRDNMSRSLDQMVQTCPAGEWGIHNYAIVDEVDSILIDVARTPLIISTADSKPSDRYNDANRIIKSLVKGSDFELEEKYKNVSLTDLGIRRVERLLGVGNLYEEDFEMVHLIEQALTAYALYEKDRDYVVKEGKVVIVDQFTGRLLPNNRFSNGLHQAIEAKENVTIQEESKTLAEISYQNYFRMYKKLAGMTGTAATEAEEFYKIYKLEVLVIPTNKVCIRNDMNDVVYKTESAKFRAVADDIEDKHKKGQPVLVGTTSVERSELLHDFLKRRGIRHEILNAKNHEREASIISQAGRKSAVTISTNMAGRGVDIRLGGDPCSLEEEEEVRKLGGLHVVGTERHESRRIDNQLRGRSGRQGDPGSSRFFVSLQDDLMRIFGGEQVQRIMDRFGMEEDIPLEAGMISKAIENSQKRVEGLNFDRRKQVVEMDDVINVHRDVVYKLRRKILELESGNIENKEWFLTGLRENSSFTTEAWEGKEEIFGQGLWLKIVSELSLPVIDLMWMEHLVDMDQVREGIGLRGYAQRDPMVEYKKEGHERFGILVSKMYAVMGERLSYVSKDVKTDKDSNKGMLQKSKVVYKHGELESGLKDEQGEMGNATDSMGRQLKIEQVPVNKEKIGRNDLCPCGSGKKYKNCHGKN